MGIQITDPEHANSVIAASVACAREVLNAQMPAVKERRLDILPAVEELTIQLFVVGVLWRYHDQFDAPTSARDRAFISMLSMLLQDGMSARSAKRKIRQLYEVSIGFDGHDALALYAGHELSPKAGALAGVFDQFSNDPAIAGARYRAFFRNQWIAIIAGIAGILISFLLGRNWIEALGVGVVIGLSIFAAALLVWKSAVR